MTHVLSQYFGDGLRITFGVVLPSLILAQFDLLKIGISFSLGAVCASIADSPGPITHRRNGMFLTIGLVTITSLLTSLVGLSVYTLGAFVVALSFLCSMLYVYGPRAASMGVAALLVMIIGIDDVRPINEILFYSLYIFLGGIWYALLSLSIYQIMPYRLARLSLAESISEVANFMRIKSGFYKEGMDYDENYKKLIEAQITVNEKLDAVREQLFKNPKIVQENSQEGRLLLVIFVDMVDLYEQIMSTFYNYQKLHKQFDHTGILVDFEHILNLLSEQIDEISESLKDGSKPEINLLLPRKLNALKIKIDTFTENDTISVIGLQSLKNIEVNIENIFNRIKKINGYFRAKEQKKLSRNDVQTTAFTTSQVYDVDTFLDNLNLKSENFRHALRVSGMMLVGFIIAQSTQLLHSNWILLTIMVIMKPAYSLTKERNLDRLFGTIGGALIGMFILNYITDRYWLFGILLICMLGTYSFQRKTYLVSVVFMTPFILILFEFLGMGSRALLIERVYDTAIGGGLAFIGSYVLLPHWEHKKLKNTLIEMLEANLAYYHQVSQMYFGEEYQRVPYKIVRKEVFVRSANLASGIQRMYSEPKNKQLSIKEVHKFSVLNHLLSSYVATLALYSREHFDTLPNFDKLKEITTNTENLLKEAIKIIEKSDFVVKENIQLLKVKNHQAEETDESTILITEQFMNIQKVGYDICKISERIDL
ncbi:MULTISPECIES: FUSC family membrane protein [Emticicia]|uniref:FUSC family protein n=1 Tax=Emticicia TaxID=312278 RepID=UPI0007D8BBA3|nr:MULTISPECIES: FUSC family membrane protein [Emticicia]